MIIRTTVALGLVLTATAVSTVASTVALADAGHIAPAGGHDHYGLVAGLALIAALGAPIIVRAIRRLG